MSRDLNSAPWQGHLLKTAKNLQDANRVSPHIDITPSALCHKVLTVSSGSRVVLFTIGTP